MPPRHFGAVVFDLDGVITNTARLHAAAWKALFDDYLAARTPPGGAVDSFDEERDYLIYVDGRPRYDGVRNFLRSRGIFLPDGSATDSPATESVCGLGNRKDRLFIELLELHGVEVFQSSVSLARALRDAGISCGIASSSKNCRPILDRAHLTDLFDVCVDGVDTADLGLAGKPAPDTFLRCCELMRAAPEHSIVMEDAVVGVEAGTRGGFRLVVGIDRTGIASELLAAGAHVVVPDLSLLSIESLDGLCAELSSSHRKPQSQRRSPEQVHTSTGQP